MIEGIKAIWTTKFSGLNVVALLNKNKAYKGLLSWREKLLVRLIKKN